MTKGVSTFVSSSFIKAVSYDGERLRVQMKNGAVYDHFGVSPKVANEVVHARSKGQAYNREIKGRYITQRVQGVKGR